MQSYYDAEKVTDTTWGKLAAAFKRKSDLLRAERDKIKKAHEKLQEKKDELARNHGGANVADSDILEINAGGDTITVTRETLTQLKGTRLEALFSGRWENQLLHDAQGRVFLDVNPSCFRSIVDYLNELKIASSENLPDPPHVDEEDKVILDYLLSFFGLDEVLNFLTFDSTIINKDDYLQALYGFLEEDGIQGEMQLLYRATRDGWSALQFHAKCDNQGATLTMIKSTEGYMFGGFADTPWTSSNAHKASPKAFLFALHSDYRQGPKKLRLKRTNDNYAVYHGSSCGPTFGSGHDICIHDNANKNKNDISIGCSYQCAQGQHGRTLTGSYYFQAAEVEVFKIDTPKKNVRNKKIPNWQKATFDEFPEDIKNALVAEQQALIEAEKELCNLKLKLDQEKHFIDFLAQGDTADIVLLNVSGKHMATMCSTLGLCPDSVLAKQFNDPLWSQRGHTTKQPVGDWDVKQVVAWVKDIKGVPKSLAKIFDENKIKGIELVALKRDDLKDLGIKRAGTLALLAKAIDELNSGRHGEAVFVEQSDYCFGKMLDHLRLKSMSHFHDLPPPSPKVKEPNQKRFKRMVKYYFPGRASRFILEDENSK